jgi:hypothetical protein
MRRKDRRWYRAVNCELPLFDPGTGLKLYDPGQVDPVDQAEDPQLGDRGQVPARQIDRRTAPPAEAEDLQAAYERFRRGNEDPGASARAERESYFGRGHI